MEKLTGGCLCGKVEFEILNEFAHFQLCHCVQCQKVTGSAHASNLFTKPEAISWHSGWDNITRFDLEGRKISNAFCSSCGSRVPYLSLNGDILVVPAGSLNGIPNKSPQANIFWAERARWYDAALTAEHFTEFIE
ncbi:MAG: GFA family protein [Proteobacteria bacterium]|nr:GFA family protein [Pseudomonadota bacterium]